MTNTRDILGDQETLEALISNDPTLTEFVENGITSGINSAALSYKNNFVMIDLGEVPSVSGFSDDRKLMHLLLHKTSIVTLNNTSSFYNTPIKGGYGTIYVPESLLTTYKNNNNWKSYLFKRLEDYPNYEFGNITDSWETIANNMNYATDYAIGDTKTVSFGEYGYMNMELVAFDMDHKADGTGKAHMTWISKDCVLKHPMRNDSSSSGGWGISVSGNIRDWLRDNIIPILPKAIRNAIVEVNKTYYVYNEDTTKTIDDTLWIPSAREVFGVINYEKSGVIYSDKFTSESSRYKNVNGSVVPWLLRSSSGNTTFCGVTTTGILFNNSSNSTYAVAPGFCIGGKSESQYWTDLVAAIKEETYTRLYSVGDKLPYTVDGNTYHAVIVGIDADEDALGNKIPFSFITEELWATVYPMNDTDTNVNGWSASKMRNTTLPAIKAQLPEYVTSNIVKAKKYSYDKTSNTDQVTYDDLWIPSMKEIGFTGTNYESGGIGYINVFTDDNSRKKIKIGTTSDAYYWARSAYSSNATYFCGVHSAGSSYGFGNASNASNVALSFCIGLDAEESLWNELYDAIDDGTYATKYAVGDKLPYTIGDNVYHAVIAGIDVDEDENGNKVPVTFVTEELYAETAAMNDTATNAGGWKESKMRKTTMPAIEALMPEHLRNRIKAVKKTSLLNDSTEQITYDEVWIPSCQEVGFDNFEINGVNYNGIFNDSKIKTKNGANYTYYLRTSFTNDNAFRSINQNGNSDYITASNSVAFPVSFSVGHVPEEIQWRMLSDAIEDGTYKKKYAIGDLIPFTTTDGDTYHAEIVAFDTDIDAKDETVPITFIVREFWKDQAKMNETNTTVGGWEKSKMRKETMPLIKSKLPSYVTNNIITVKKTSSIYNATRIVNGQITYDDIWIPSVRELLPTNATYEQTMIFYNIGVINRTYPNGNGRSNTYVLRSVDNGQYFVKTQSATTVSTSIPSALTSFAFGFCFGTSEQHEYNLWNALDNTIKTSQQDLTTQYPVGTEIPYTIDGTTYHAVVAGLGEDVDTEDNTIPVSFVTKELYGTKYRMNSTNTNDGGWNATEIRTTTLPSILAQMPSYVVNAIVPAKKISGVYPSGTQNTVDALWVPSAYEVTGSGYEGTGVKYTDLFIDNASRIKLYDGTISSYWLRTAYSSDSEFIDVVASSGSVSYSNPNREFALPISFCIGESQPPAYGVVWDYSVNSSACTRTGLAENFSDPVPATNNEGAGSSPFDSIYPWSEMKVYNVLNNGTLIEKGETGFSMTDYDTVVYIPEFYVKVDNDKTNSKLSLQISGEPEVGFVKHPGSGRYIGRYHTVSNSFSKSGLTPTGNVTLNSFRDYARGKGDGWYTIDYASWNALQWLYIVEYADFNFQDMLGNGSSGSAIANTGGTDEAIYHTIKSIDTHNMYRWIENPCGNILTWIDGIIGNTSVVYVSPSPDNNGSFSTSIRTNLKLPSTGYISRFDVDGNANWAFIPTGSSSLTDGFVTSKIESTTTGVPMISGGSRTKNTYFGMFYSKFSYVATYAESNIGARLIYIVK